MSAAELQTYKDSAGIYEQEQNYNKIFAGYGTGLHPPTEEGWSEIAENAYMVQEISYQTTLPAAVDHTAEPWFPPIGNQAHQGSCASFAVGYYCKTYQEAKEHSWDLSGATWTGGADDGNISKEYQSKVMSPAFVYNLINGGVDQGSDFETPIRLVSNIGVCSWENMPYYWQDCTRWPTEAAWSQAPLYRSNSTYSYQYLYANTAGGVESLKNWLAAGNLAVIAIDATDNLWNYGTQSIRLNSQDLLTADNYCVGPLDHAATIVGYDDLYTYMENGTVHHGAIKIANTWGVGRWENILDGCYWITYGAIQKMSTSDNPVMLFQDLTDYQPEVLASFNITHEARGDCNITFGLGTPTAPIATKNFTDFISGGNRSFCPNKIVFDITEFKTNLSSLYNQAFYMQVYDKGTETHGTANTGTINYFAVANTSSTQTPLATANEHYVNLTLTNSFAPTTLEVTLSSGPSGAEITLSGVGFRGNTVDVSYYDPIVGQWVPVLSGYPVSTNFTYATHAPDLKQCSTAGDNQPIYDNVVYRVQDNGNWYNASCNVWRRGLVQVNNQTANGVFGNNTDFSKNVFVQNGQTVQVAGKWFNPGLIVIGWDDQNFSSTTTDSTGFFNTSITVPSTTAGKHNVTFFDRYSNLSTTITRLPTVTTNFTDAWYTQDYSVNIAADYSGCEAYYRVNNGQTYTVSADGQPTFTSEAVDNKLEYWSTWNIYGTGNMELSHNVITGMKQDKTAPTAFLQINGGYLVTTSNTVALTLAASDYTSGIKQVRISNDAAFTQASWETYSTSKNWQLTSGAGAKTVYYQVQDNAGLTTIVSASIVVNAPQAIAAPSPTAAPTPTVPEYSTPLFIMLLAILTASALITVRWNKKN